MKNDYKRGSHEILELETLLTGPSHTSTPLFFGQQQPWDTGGCIFPNPGQKPHSHRACKLESKNAPCLPDSSTAGQGESF